MSMPLCRLALSAVPAPQQGAGADACAPVAGTLAGCSSRLLTAQVTLR